MKTQKIVINGVKPNTYKVIDVPASLVDIGSEHVTFVHRDPRYYNQALQNPRYFAHWHVSEQSTGNIVAIGRTRKLAIEKARHTIETIGSAGVKDAIERQLAYLKTINIPSLV